MGSSVQRLTMAVLAVPVAAFFGFVGWHKAFAPLAELARHHAWTVFLPAWAGRLVGWSELAMAAGLLAALAPRGAQVVTASALLLLANQLVAAAVHLAHGEAGALPQNLGLIAALAVIALLARGHFILRKEPST